MISVLRIFERALTKPEQREWAELTSPRKIQDFLDRISYSNEWGYRCPLRVLRERMAHCFDGALFGAAAMRRLGNPALIVNMLANGQDDDHMLALYRHNGHWGAIAKSNFAGLRFREPVYRTLHELVLSYFEDFYNVKRRKTLRKYTVPLNLKAFDKFDWMTSDRPLERIGERLDEIRKFRLLTRRMIAGLSMVDERSYRAGLLGANQSFLYQPSRK